MCAIVASQHSSTTVIGQAPFEEDASSGLVALESILAGRYNMRHAAAASKHFTPAAKDLGPPPPSVVRACDNHAGGTGPAARASE